MYSFQKSIEIDADASRVWKVMQDVTRWSEWTPTITSVQWVVGDQMAVGARALIRQPKLLPATWEVTDLRPGESFTWVSARPGVRATATHSVERTERGCRVTLGVVFSGLLAPLVAALTRKLTASYVTTEAEKLKAHCESLGRQHARPA